MFGGNFWAGSIAGGDDHSERQREPPARPTKLDFPRYVPPFAPRRLDMNTSSRAQYRTCHIRSFTELSDEDLSYFNIKYDQEVTINDVLPHDRFQTRPLPYDEDLNTMLAEISVENHDAFREILRMEPRPGRTRPRLAYARNFFGSLEDMARYWDTSMDQYYSVPIDQKSTPLTVMDGPYKSDYVTSNSSTSRIDNDVEILDANSKDDTPKLKEVYKGYRFGNGEQLNPGTRVALMKNLLKMIMHKFVCRDHEPMPSPREKLVIRGVRIHSIQYQFCVARVPKDTKLARARLVEGPLMAVHCREETRFTQESQAPTDAIVSLASATSETPTTSSARSAQRKTGTSASGHAGERFDFLREVGCMLILAAQRNREGKHKSTYSGSDKWWVTNPRFGNGPTKWGQIAIEAYEDDDPSWSPEEKQLQDEKRIKDAELRERSRDAASELLTGSKMSVDDMIANNAPSLQPVPGDPMQRPRKKKLRSLDRPAGKEEEVKDGRRLMYVPYFKKKWYQEWQRLRPNTPMWDDKAIYKRIGMIEGAEFDDVYMLSCVNHHVALLRMKVHPQYLAWIEAGQEVPSEEVDGLRKDVLHIQRSTWYDMFDISARAELLIALWRLMCWLNRDSIDKAEFERL